MEKEVVKSFVDDGNLIAYSRDDTHAITPKGKLEMVMQKIKNFHNKLQFTMENLIQIYHF